MIALTEDAVERESIARFERIQLFAAAPFLVLPEDERCTWNVRRSNGNLRSNAERAVGFRMKSVHDENSASGSRSRLTVRSICTAAVSADPGRHKC